MTSFTSTPVRKLIRRQSVLDSVTKLIPAGHEKPLKQALYTTAALILFSGIICVVVSAYFVLQLFVKPLLWAVLCGSFLFPFKYTLHKVLENWLTQTLDSNVPLVVNTCILPVFIFAKLSDWLGELLASKWKILSLFVTGLLTVYMLHYFGLLTFTLSIFTSAVEWIWVCIYYTMNFFKDHSGKVLILLILYFLAAIILNMAVFRIASFAMWIILGVYAISNTGSLQIPITLVIGALLILGTLKGKSVATTESNENEDKHTTDFKGSTDTSHQNNSSSEMYFNVLFIMFGLVVVWLHMWILSLMLIPLTFWFCKKALLHEKTLEILDALSMRLFNKNMTTIHQNAMEFWSSHKAVIFPYPLPSFFSVLNKGDKNLHLGILSTLPTVTSILIILILFSNAMFMAVFMTVKIQQESFLMVQVTSNLINETVSQHPEYQSWLPGNETMQKSMDSLVDTAYSQGREWITQKIHTTIGQNANVTKVEKQVLKMWDQIYQSLFTTNKKSRPRLDRKSSFKHTSEISLVSGFVDLLNMNEVISWLQDNVSALMSIVESLVSILRSNITLIMSVSSAVFTTILNGSTIVLNFVVSMVIFFTTLFYLLASSTDQYKPLEIIGYAFSPLTVGTPVERAIQDAVSGVFGASIKMFGFYGLYTWVNHCLFGSNLVYVPSVLAAVFGVIPLLTTYWVCLPSALEIWLFQGSLLRAVGLIICQFLPTLFVDAAIYKDISKTGGGAHPYITGLAVAGGVYTFGLEGAITGPLILCFLLVAGNLYSSETSSDMDRKIK